MTEKQAPTRLYQLPDAEICFADPAEVWESEIEPFGNSAVTSWDIEEWTVVPPVNHLPSPDYIADWLAEAAADNELDEAGSDAFDAAVQRPDVMTAIENLRCLIARHVRYRMADQLVATHELTLDEAGSPLLNGDPLYHQVEEPGAPPTPKPEDKRKIVTENDSLERE